MHKGIWIFAIFFLFSVSVAFAATTRYVSTTGIDTGDCSSPAAPCQTIQYAIDQSGDGDTINVAAGTYDEGLIDINRNLQIIGDTVTKPILRPTEDTIHINHRGWIQVSGDVDVTIKNLELNGQGKNIENGI